MRKVIAIIVALGFAGSVTLPEVLAAPVSNTGIKSDELSSASHEKKAMEKKDTKKTAKKKSTKKKAKKKAKTKM